MAALHLVSFAGIDPRPVDRRPGSTPPRIRTGNFRLLRTAPLPLGYRGNTLTMRIARSSPASQPMRAPCQGIWRQISLFTPTAEDSNFHHPDPKSSVLPVRRAVVLARALGPIGTCRTADGAFVDFHKLFGIAPDLGAERFPLEFHRLCTLLWRTRAQRPQVFRGSFVKFDIHEPAPGLEPGRSAWKAGMLTLTSCRHLDAWGVVSDPEVMDLIRTSRPFRTLVQGFALDIAIAVVLVLATAFNEIEWTPKYWAALGLTVAKSVLQAGASYWMRNLIKPKEDPQAE